MIFVYREFARYNEDGSVKYIIGSISANVTKYNIIEILICKLHDHGDGIQSTMAIKYDCKLNMYETISNILDKLSYDLHYKYTDEKPYHKDYIVNHNKKIKFPEKWNYIETCGRSGRGKVWMDFTRENAKYIIVGKTRFSAEIRRKIIWKFLCEGGGASIKCFRNLTERPAELNRNLTEQPAELNDDYFVFCGEVMRSGEFVYDYPVIESSCTEEIYKETRGKY